MNRKIIEGIFIVLIIAVNCFLFLDLTTPNPFATLQSNFPRGCLYFQMKSMHYPYETKYYRYDLTSRAVTTVNQDKCKEFISHKEKAEWLPLKIKSNGNEVIDQGVWRELYYPDQNLEIVYYTYRKSSLIGTGGSYRQYFWKELNSHQAVKIHLPPRAEVIGWERK